MRELAIVVSPFAGAAVLALAVHAWMPQAEGVLGYVGIVGIPALWILRLARVADRAQRKADES